MDETCKDDVRRTGNLVKRPITKRRAAREHLQSTPAQDEDTDAIFGALAHAERLPARERLAFVARLAVEHSNVHPDRFAWLARQHGLKLKNIWRDTTLFWALVRATHACQLAPVQTEEAFHDAIGRSRLPRVKAPRARIDVISELLVRYAPLLEDPDADADIRSLSFHHRLDNATATYLVELAKLAEVLLPIAREVPRSGHAPGTTAVRRPVVVDGVPGYLRTVTGPDGQLISQEFLPRGRAQPAQGVAS